jgi:UDP-N-acetylmuramoyl-tripeptide--D-alanyl-D-alanine ligase
MGISLEEASAALKNVIATDRRLKAVKIGGIYLLDDSYNASPDSMKAGISALCGVDAKRRIAVLGDMLELGPRSEELHHGVGAYAARAGVDLVVCCGALSEAIADGAREAGGNVLYFRDKAQLLASLGDVVRPGDCVLVKASHSMAFEEIVERLTAE